MAAISVGSIQVAIHRHTIARVAGRGGDRLLGESTGERFLNAISAINLRAHTRNANAGGLTIPCLIASEMYSHSHNCEPGCRLRHFQVRLTESPGWRVDTDLAEDFSSVQRGRQHIDKEVIGLDNPFSAGAYCYHLRAKR